ncbi:hypothetical protein AMATHDRAFT_66539 [Amanita thiersii Skay4041]|uniref:Uncharacterized protein n=1 Tax=Amanita thiersii Skay4041 TaxID=703135 RepID=A0A2A9NHZ4_9AGAR|nr:hypothetical protein AMATHDRAFT_66539 [Amanita thiersii Skay4041]
MSRGVMYEERTACRSFPRATDRVSVCHHRCHPLRVTVSSCCFMTWSLQAVPCYQYVRILNWRSESP